MVQWCKLHLHTVHTSRFRLQSGMHICNFAYYSKSIHSRFLYLILFYHLKKQFYQLYHTIYNIPSIPKLYYFTIWLKYYFLIFFYYFSFSPPFPLFHPQPLAPASTSSKPIPSKITRSKSQQKFTQIKQAPELNNLNL